MGGSGGRSAVLEWLVALIIASVFGAAGWFGYGFWLKHRPAPAAPVSSPSSTANPSGASAEATVLPAERAAGTEQGSLPAEKPSSGIAEPTAVAARLTPSAAQASVDSSVEAVAPEAGAPEVAPPEVVPSGPPPTAPPEIRFEALAAPTPDPAWPG